MNVKSIAAGAALLLVGIGIGGSMNSETPSDERFVAANGTQQKLVTAPSETTVTTAAPTTTTTEASTTTTTEAPTTTTTAPPPKWVKVATLTGQGDKSGAPYTLQGGQQRVTYSCSMPADGYVGSTTFRPTDDFFESFDCETEEGKTKASGNSMMYEDAGTYHVDVNATPNNSWSITIEELR